MNILTLDTENTTWNTGNPFDERNFNCCISTYDGRNAAVHWPEYREDFARLLGQAHVLVGFNLKYDLHWLKRLGFDFAGKRVYDCQVAEFFYGRQQDKYPSLDGVSHRRLGERKIDIIETEYWNKGINTHEIPRDILAEYAIQDVMLTWKLYQFYQNNMPDYMRKIMGIRMLDLLGLQEMEWNGLSFDRKLVESKAEEAEAEIAQIRSNLELFHKVPGFKWTSPVHVSALLYGGTIEETVKVPVGIYKSGKKAGEVRYKNEIREHHLPRMYKPIKGSETEREGVWSVSEEYLVQLKGGGELIKGILRIKALEKLNGTYLRGLLENHAELHIPNDIVHGQFNQVVTTTGRLSSSKPNMQNIAGAIKNIFKSRYVN